MPISFGMRSVKIWCGGMVGLVGGFVVVLLLLRELVIRDGTTPVTENTAVWALVAITVPVILGPVLGVFVAAWLTRLTPGRQVEFPWGHGLVDRGPSSPGDEFGDWSGLAVLLGGVAVDDEGVWELARLVEKPLSQKLETALLLRSGVVRVTSQEREAILKALEEAPDTLQGVRELLLTDEQWRLSESVIRTSCTVGPEPAELSATA